MRSFEKKSREIIRHCSRGTGAPDKLNQEKKLSKKKVGNKNKHRVSEVGEAPGKVNNFGSMAVHEFRVLADNKEIVV